ncbi:hypothetical protein [Hoyosella altamirensis]|uniref:Plasmid segregation centromere-binding protein ParG n=1 Tax=Hoyosella altamirensis TaxID=616997 RepID=A0A839RVZ3_9ACTN|nr:hypothetical protein [Hoyosella altamirensis]MBB3040194.1 hypothetical protein [Hoyosella altamirensis]
MSKRVSITAKQSKSAPSRDDWVSAASEPAASVDSEQPQQPMKRLTIDIPEDLHRALKVGCAQRDIKMADEVRRLIRSEYGHSLNT